MIVVIFMTSLITIIVLLLTSAIYIIKILFESTEDVSFTDTFTGMDAQTDLSQSYNPDNHRALTPSSMPLTNLDKRNVTVPDVIDAIQSDNNKCNNSSNLNNGNSNANLNISKQLFDDFDQRDVKLGGTGLHWCKSRATFDNLIKIGLALNSLNCRQETPLHVAVRRKRLPILIGLLCHGAELECRNEMGETPLIIASKINDIYACQLLLVFDANVNVVDNRGFSPRHYTAQISSRYKKQKPNITNSYLPVVSDVILAMLHEMGAKRCSNGRNHSPNQELTSGIPIAIKQISHKQTTCVKGGKTIDTDDKEKSDDCSEGCSSYGTFNGNSHNRWSNFENESFHKDFLFKDIIESKFREATSKSSRKVSRLLCIDGGGMRGVIVCQAMIEISKYLKRPLYDYFDWIGGTSVGAFLTCSMCTGKSLAELRRISFNVKDEVFSGQKPYESSFLERVLKRTVGSTTRMYDVKDKKLIVTTVIADRDPCQLTFFRNYTSPHKLLETYGYMIPQTFESTIKQNSADLTISSKGNTQNIGKRVVTNHSIKSLKQLPTTDQMIDENEPNPFMWQAIRASAAAPFFFKPYGPYLDGGIISNNPTLDMMTEFFSFQKSRSFIRSRVVDISKSIETNTKLELVLSLGTGRVRPNPNKQAMIDFSCVTAGLATVFSPVELVRSIRAIRDLFRKMLQQSCQTDEHIVDRAQGWCASLEIPYYRINPPLANIFSIDDKRDEQLINALWQTKLYMKSMSKELKELAKILDKDVCL